MAWEQHYTGIEINEQKWLGDRVDLYRQRITRDKTVTMIRFSWRKLYRRDGTAAFRMIGLFPTRSPIYDRAGWAVFTNNLGFGWQRDELAPLGFPQERKPHVNWSGSWSHPFTRCILRFGALCINFNSPKWLVHLARRRQDAEIDRIAKYHD